MGVERMANLDRYSKYATWFDGAGLRENRKHTQTATLNMYDAKLNSYSQ